MLRMFLYPLAWIYYAVYYLWDIYWNITQAERADAKLISVGNIAVGGTGKTSLVEYLAKRLCSKGIKTAVVARGYKRPGSSSLEICIAGENCWENCGDEPSALARSVDGLKVYVDSSKSYAAIKAGADGHDVVIVDDGFQHRRLERDIDIVCIDGADPFGNGQLLPYGILREPIQSLKRADIIIVFPEKGHQAFSTAGFPESIPVFSARKIVSGVKSTSGESIDITGRKAAAFCGIGNPESFRGSLIESGSKLVLFEKFKDHFIYKDNDINDLIKRSRDSGAELVVTTLKDFVKVEKIWPEDIKLYYLKINVEIDKEDEFIELIER